MDEGQGNSFAAGSFFFGAGLRFLGVNSNSRHVHKESRLGTGASLKEVRMDLAPMRFRERAARCL